jgi:Tol biopolymer transport system component
MTAERPPESSSPEAPLESWKAIAAYLQRDIRTAKRWEARERLPVHRLLHQSRSSVYAYPSELNAWRATREPLDTAAATLGPRGRILALAPIIVWALAAQSDWGAQAGARRVMDAGGLTLRQVWAGADVDTSGRVSPDGRYLSFIDWDTGDLAVRTIATGETRRLTDKGSWTESNEMAQGSAFAPDGKRLAYCWMVRSGHFELRIIGIDGAGVRVLHQNPEIVYYEPKAWSPDGANILVTFLRKDQTTELALVSAADGAARTLKVLDARWPGAAFFSPNGQYVAYDFRSKESAPPRDIFLLDVASGHDAALVRQASDDGLLGWTADGRGILMTSDRSGRTDGWFQRVEGGQARGAPELFKRDLGEVEPLGMTAGGSLYYGLMTGGSEVWVAEIDQGSGTIVAGPKQVSERYAGSNRYSTWSSDGRYLVYVSARGRGSTPGSKTIVVHPLGGGEDRDIPLKDLMQFRPFGACGRSGGIIGAGVRRNKSDVYLVDLASGDIREIVPGQVGVGLSLPACSPDERVVYFLRHGQARPPRILSWEIASGAERLLHTMQPNDRATGLAVSPDDASLAFSIYVRETSIIYSMPARGGTPRELWRGPGLARPITWSSDGERLLFSRQDPSPGARAAAELWSLPMRGGSARRLAAFDKTSLMNLQIHPDGRLITYSAGEDTAEVWVIEGLGRR